MEEAKVLDLYSLNYSDLILLSKHRTDNVLQSLSNQQKDLQRLETLRTSILENLGPNGPGLISISNVPNASFLQNSLLPLARRLSLLHPENRNKLLKVFFPSFSYVFWFVIVIVFL